MNARTALGFRPAGALEHAAFVLGAAPLSVHTVMFPVWCVQVRATVTEAQPYQLIDRYLIRGIAEAGLTGSAELASFLALDPALVRQALAFLRAVRHVEGEDGSLALTALGERSLRDGTMYTVGLDDRRVLRFDGCSSGPLTRAYYDRAGAGLAAAAQEGRTSMPLLCPEPFRDEAVAELDGLADRERYNLPAAVELREVVGRDVEYLPACVVRTARPYDGARHLVFPRPLRGEPDLGLGHALETSPSCTSALTEAHRGALSAFEEEAGRWLSTRGLAHHQPRRGDGGPYRVGLAEDAFRGADSRARRPLGSLVVLPSGGFFQMWCEDVRARRREVLRRLGIHLGVPRAPEAVRARLALLGAQLDPGPLDDDALYAVAAEEGDRALADRLRRILSES
ncbi:hypothetical protein [Streptomyces sp. NPDC093094]|uniref:hypothetical protein n=1 Tax=Streptomyces sp. NPDC093094 TaxID=3366026 RepID=UPI003818D2DE